MISTSARAPASCGASPYTKAGIRNHKCLLLGRLEAPAWTTTNCGGYGPGSRGACHRAGQRPDPLACPGRRGMESRCDNFEVAGSFCAPTAALRASIHHDLDAVSRLDLGVAFEAVEDAEASGGMIDGGHAMRQRVHGVARLHGDHLDAQRPCRLDFIQREAAERIDGFADVAVALGGLLLGRENEPIDVAAELQHIGPKLPLIALRDR